MFDEAADSVEAINEEIHRTYLEIGISIGVSIGLSFVTMGFGAPPAASPRTDGGGDGREAPHGADTGPGAHSGSGAVGRPGERCPGLAEGPGR